MSNFIICCLTNLFRIYLIDWFIKIFCPDSTPKPKKKILYIVGFFVSNTGLYWIFQIPLLNLIINFIGISLLTSLYTKSFRKIFFLTFSFYIISMTTEGIIISLFVDYTPNKPFNQLYAIIVDILILACVLVAEHLVDRQTGKDHIPNLALLLVPLISIVILYLLVVNDTDLDYKVMIECIGLLAINFLVFYLYNALKNSLHHKYESDMLRQKMQGYSTQMETLLQNDEKIRIFRHDMRHHIMELQTLAKQNDTDALLSYLDQMNQALTIQRESVSSGNPEIDSLLNYWLYKAKQTLQTVDVQVRLPEEILHTFDINSVVANLLQNAIEASSQSAEKYLSFSLSLSKGVLKLRIRNSFSEEAKSSRSRFFSSKKQDTLHGFGLRSVRHIVEKYDGVLELNKQGNMFEANAILYLPDEADN